MIFLLLFVVPALVWHLHGVRTLDVERGDRAFWRTYAQRELLERGPDHRYWL